MRVAMTRHDALIESAVAESGGVVVRPRGEGDSRFAVFERPLDAVAAAVTIQRRLSIEPWTIPAPLRVRIGLHTGPADLRDGDYYGTAVNRCARLRSAAHGGQTLLSQATYDLVFQALPEDVRARDLGEYRLKDLQQAEHLYELVIPGLPADFPPLKAMESLQTNLPAPLTSFVGREREIAEVKRLLTMARLLTIVGSGGAGKTRLALRVAGDLLGSFSDGVWLVDLSPMTNPALLIRFVADVLGVREEESRPLQQSLIHFLHPKNALLILDNCEHLIQGIAQLMEVILRGAPDLRILATSREAINIPGEMSWRIPPLSTPRLSEVDESGNLNQYDAVKLFVDRAVSIKPDFAVTETTAPGIAKICARLDGIPLALELAAARLRVLSVEEIAARLDDRFRLLVGGSRTALPRQQTLRALIDWSYELLSDNERILLRRLAIFAGGWTLEAAEEVCSNRGIQPFEVLDLLSHLVDKSLVLAEPHEGHERYRFLETIRQYALERLIDGEEKDELERQHAWYFLRMAQESYGNLWGPKQGLCLAQLEIEHENLRTALEWTAKTPDRAEMLLRMAASLWRFWEIRGYISEGRAWLELALVSNPGAPAPLHAHALRGVGSLARQHGDYQQARAMHEQSLALFQEIEDKLGIGRELDALGEIAHSLGDYPQAVAFLTESLAIRYEINDKEGMAMSFVQLGNIALDRGQFLHARELLEESLDLNRERGDKLYTAFSLNSLGLVAYSLCEYARAISLFEEALALYRELMDRLGISNTLFNLGNVAKDQGYFARAMTLYGECLALKEELGEKRGYARTIAGMAEVAFTQGSYPRAADLADQSLALFRELGVKRGVNNALVVRAFVAHFQGENQLALSLVAESLDISTEMGAPRGVAYAKALVGLNAYAQSRLVEAKETLEESLAIFRKVGDRRSVAQMLINLARVAYRQRDFASASQLLEESLAISKELDIRWCWAFSLEIMGLLQRSQGDLGRASALFQESLRLSAEQENLQGILNCLGAIAGLAGMVQQPARSARLFAAAEKMRDAVGVKMGHSDRQEYEGYLTLLRSQLDVAAFNAAWSEGTSMTIEQAVEEANQVQI